MKLRSVAALALLTAVAFVHAENLPRDPNNVYGTLENGLDYVIRHNANPPGRVNVYLHVKTGAMNETDQQNGIAHFVEHMAFNGSTNFPPGKLLPLLGSLGMTFGADTNAHTSLQETVYKLNLPDTKPQTIDLAMKIFSDYAGGLTLSDAEIESERKVILEEYRTGTGPQKRLGDQFNRDVFAGTRLAKHDVIGDAEQIKTFTPQQFRDYYDKWYRPDNMTLIVVGDVTADQVLPAAKKWLSGVTPRIAGTPQQKAGLKPTTQPAAYVYTDAEQVEGNVSVVHLGPAEKPITTVEQLRTDVLRDIATGIVNRRYRNLISAGKAAFREAGADVSPFLNETVFSGVDATGEPKDWKTMLSGAIAEIDRGLEHGFSEAEMKLIIAGMLNNAERDATAESTRDSTAVINQISRDIGQDRPLLSAQQRLDLLKQVTAKLDVRDVNRAFDDAFGTQAYVYVLNLPANKDGFSAPTPAEVLSTAEAAWANKTEPLKEAPNTGNLVEKVPTPGKVASQSFDDDLKVMTLTFENGVVLHHKFSNYKKDTVYATITLPGGELEETADNHGVSDLAGTIFDRPATRSRKSADLADYLVGKTIRLTGSIGRDALGIRLQTNSADFKRGLILAYALLTEGNLEQAAVDDWKKQQLQAVEEAERTPQGQMQKAVGRTLYAGDPRLAPLTAENVKRLTREQAQAWFDRIAKSAAIEVSVVGDVTVGDAAGFVAGTLGALPKREKGFDALDALRDLHRGPGPFKADESFASVTPQAIAVGGFISCDRNSRDRRPLALAADVLTNRMIDRIREKEQLVYSIDCDNSPSVDIPGTGLFSAGSMCDPANSAKVADTVLEMLNDFAKTGPTDEELATAKKQIITQVTTAMREPGFWSGQLATLTYRKQKLEELKELPAIYDTFTKDDLRTVVGKYLKPETTVRLVVTPKEGTSPASKPATTAPAATQP